MPQMYEYFCKLLSQHDGLYDSFTLHTATDKIRWAILFSINDQ